MVPVNVLFPGNERGGAATHLLALADAVGRDEHAAQFHWWSVGGGPLERAMRDVVGSAQTMIPGAPRAALAALVAGMRESHETALWHSNGPRLNVLTCIAARIASRPWITTIHSDVRKDFLSSRLKSIVFTRLHSICLKFCRGGFVGNRAFARYLPDKPVFIVPNAVPPQPLAEPKEHYQANLKSKLGIPPQTSLVGIAARFDPVKDIPTVLRAFSRLADMDAHLVIAGDGQQRGELTTLIHSLGMESRTHLLGFLDDVIPFYAALDVHVLASRSEGASPFAVLEAGSCDVVNIGSDIPGIRSLLEPGINGMCFPAGSDQVLAEKIRQVLTDEALRIRLTTAFRNDVLPKFTADAMAAAYLEGYRALADKEQV